MSWQDAGFDDSFERKKKMVRQDEIPQISPFTADSVFTEIPGSKISRGIIKSQNGKLEIDLDNGTLTYNDGVVDLLKVGGDDNNLTLKSSSDTTLISS